MNARLETLERLARDIKNVTPVILSPTLNDAALLAPGSLHVWPEVQWNVKRGPESSRHAVLIVINTLAVPMSVDFVLDPARLSGQSWTRVLAPYETATAALEMAT